MLRRGSSGRVKEERDLSYPPYSSLRDMKRSGLRSDHFVALLSVPVTAQLFRCYKLPDKYLTA